MAKLFYHFTSPGVILKLLVHLRYLATDELTEEGQGSRLPLPCPPQGRNLPGHNLPPRTRDHPVESLPGCARIPARTALCSGKDSHSFLQIFILLKSSSLPGVLRLKTTASHSCRKWEYNWHYYLYGDQFSNSDRE